MNDLNAEETQVDICADRQGGNQFKTGFSAKNFACRRYFAKIWPRPLSHLPYDVADVLELPDARGPGDVGAHGPAVLVEANLVRNVVD